MAWRPGHWDRGRRGGNWRWRRGRWR
ncbi:MAG TPA: hypothetical protein VFB72_00880 [Verrucomicrobiae bacterium]|nr:hypothetical protein [Verrucomicrobiae bacterium]